MKTVLKFKAKGAFRPKRRVRPAVAAPGAEPQGRIPRLTRLLALAHRFEKMIRDGDVWDYAELARLGHVTRARLTQIMNLLSLAPEIQEQILFLAPVAAGDDPIRERQVRGIVAVLDWRMQRREWSAVLVAPARSREAPPASRIAALG